MSEFGIIKRDKLNLFCKKETLIMKKNSHPVKVVEIKDYEGLYANSHPYQVEIEGGGGGETYNDFTGATASTAGEHGLVPAPKAGDNNKYLKGDGTWAEVSGGGGSGIPTDATFWGQSYDSVNNKVNGNIISGSNATSITLASSNTTSVDSGRNHIFVAPTSGFPAYGLQLNSANSNGVWFSIAGKNAFIKFTSTALELGSASFLYPIKYLADPTAAQDATTKNYVDNLTISYAALNGTAAPTTATEGKYVGQLYYDTTNEQLYFLKEIDDTTTPATYTWETVGGSSVNVVQTTGNSQTDVMSQVATSQLIYPIGSVSTHKHIAIGESASSSNAYDHNIAIGYKAKANGQGAIAIGSEIEGDQYNQPTASGSSSIVIGGRSARATESMAIAIGRDARATNTYSIALGGYPGGIGSSTSRSKELSIGKGTAGDANEETRYIAHVTDPQYVTDAANKRYVDTAVASAGAATYTNAEFNNLWENA